MTPDIKVVAVIPARGGSKGIPRKNITMVAGKPLIAWSIEAARGCPHISRIIVSSDDDEILAVAASFGVETLKRPPELATDTARSEPVLLHALKTLRERDETPKWALYLQPTSPLRTSEHLNRALALIEEKNGDALMAVYEIENKILKAYLLTGDGYLTGVANNDFPNMNRQQLPKVYMPNGAIYIVSGEQFLATPHFWKPKTIPFLMSTEESVDLDSQEDIPIIEKVLQLRST